jgi:ferric-dicitrate binding protein FerR (iron transport regulator)
MNDTEQPDINEEDVAHLLRAVGRREELPGHLRQSWEAHFSSELARTGLQRRRRRSRLLAVCAGLLLATIASLVAIQQSLLPGAAPVVARVVNIVGAEHSLSGRLETEEGHHLVSGSTLATGTATWIAVAYGHYDLRLNSDTHIEFTEQAVRLLSGEIYISSTAGSSAEGITVTTPHGTIRDIGTQFSVTLDDNRTVTRVRQGEILVASAGARHRAVAGAGNAREVSFDAAGELRADDVPAQGPQWDWIFQPMPDFSLEGKSAYEFLSWSAGESGLQLIFADHSAEIYARTTLLHGDISRLTPLAALQPVLATTDLRAEQRGDGTLQIQLLPSHRR